MGIIGGNVWREGNTVFVRADGRVLVIPQMDKKYIKKVDESVKRMSYYDPKRGFRRTEKPLPANERDIAAITKYNEERRLVRSWMPIVDYLQIGEKDRKEYAAEMFIQQFGVESVPEDALDIYQGELDRLANVLIKHM